MILIIAVLSLDIPNMIHFTVQSLYNTPHYSMDLDIRLSCGVVNKPLPFKPAVAGLVYLSLFVLLECVLMLTSTTETYF